jgi:hypothetical protein
MLRSEFTILAVEDNTEIEITPTASSFNGARQANTTFKITQKLNKGDIYQYQSANDVSGSLIRTLGSCKPIAVFSGSTWSAFCEDGNTRTNPNVSIPGKPTPVVAIIYISSYFRYLHGERTSLPLLSTILKMEMLMQFVSSFPRIIPISRLMEVIPLL